MLWHSFQERTPCAMFSESKSGGGFCFDISRCKTAACTNFKLKTTAVAQTSSWSRAVSLHLQNGSNPHPKNKKTTQCWKWNTYRALTLCSDSRDILRTGEADRKRCSRASRLTQPQLYRGPDIRVLGWGDFICGSLSWHILSSWLFASTTKDNPNTIWRAEGPKWLRMFKQLLCQKKRGRGKKKKCSSSTLLFSSSVISCLFNKIILEWHNARQWLKWALCTTPKRMAAAGARGRDGLWWSHHHQPYLS